MYKKKRVTEKRKRRLLTYRQKLKYTYYMYIYVAHRSPTVGYTTGAIFHTSNRHDQVGTDVDTKQAEGKRFLVRFRFYSIVYFEHCCGRWSTTVVAV